MPVTGFLRQRFLLTGTRRWHVWTGGSGPAVVLIHGSPGNARLVTPLAERLAARFTVYAFDTPGFGLSDPLPGKVLGVMDLADAYRDALDAVGLTRVAVYGTHTGAAIGLEFARRYPSRVCGFVLEGVPIFSVEEQRPLLTDDYMPHFDPDVLGGHYARTWTRFHDQFLWFPWNQRDPRHLNEACAGSADEIHLWVAMYFQAMQHYRPAYRSAIEYGEEAIAAASAVRSPGVYLAERADMLHPHLDRLPPLHAGQRIVRLESSAETAPAVESALRSLPEAAAGVKLPAVTVGLEEGFHDLSTGQIFVRSAGPHGPPPILLLHDAPGSARPLLPLYRTLAARAPVLLPDLPGCGLSDPLSDEVPALAEYGDALARMIMERVGGPVAVYAVGFGAAVALELNRRHPQCVRSLLLTGLLRISGVQRSALIGKLAPPITLRGDGSHWYRTWLMLRDSLVHWPWYDRDPSTLRRQRKSFDAQRLHDWTCDVMNQWPSYHHVIDAVLRSDPAESLRQVGGKLTLVIDRDDVMAGSDIAWARSGEMRSITLADDLGERGLQIELAAREPR
jgi:pimeloyl-ACP methyl ester carboxylesterase